MKFEIVLALFVLFFLVLAVAIKKWEAHEKKKADKK